MQTVPVGQLSEYAGQDLEVSDWFAIDQDRIEAAADAILSHQSIHFDQEAGIVSPGLP